MNANKKKIITWRMMLYELRNITGNPFVHIFGIGMPLFMAVFITRTAVSEMTDAAMVKNVSTSIFLGIGALIPMATVLMGYAVLHAQELEKGIPERLRLFGIKNYVTICNRALSELIFLSVAFALYFLTGILFMDLEAPVFSGHLHRVFQRHMFCNRARNRRTRQAVQRHVLHHDAGLFCLHDAWRDDGHFV